MSPQDAPGLHQPARAALHDEQAPDELRRFAFVVLRDLRDVIEEDWRAFRALLLADAPAAQATEAHGAALSGLRALGTAPMARRTEDADGGRPVRPENPRRSRRDAPPGPRSRC